MSGNRSTPTTLLAKRWESDRYAACSVDEVFGRGIVGRRLLNQAFKLGKREKLRTYFRTDWVIHENDLFWPPMSGDDGNAVSGGDRDRDGLSNGF